MARLLVLEWHQPAAEIAGYLEMLGRETEWSAFFVWSDANVDGFGLVDAAGEPKPEYHAFQAAAAAEGGDMAAPKSLEEAEQSEDWQLGARWQDQPILTFGPLRVGTYTYGIGIQRDADVWQLPDFAPSSKFFRPTPG
jgi:hypothetical protein